MIKMIKMIIVIGTELANAAHSVQNLGLPGNRNRSPGTLIIIMIIFPAKKIDFDLDGGFNLFSLFRFPLDQVRIVCHLIPIIF